jgi:integrase
MPPRKRRPRGIIEELPSGSFRARVYAGADPLTRKARYVRETHKTYAEAEKALTRLQSEVDEDRHPRGDVTVRQAVAQWLEVADLADTTRERYEDLIRLYVLPVLGDRPADKLDARVLEQLYARLQRCRDLCGGRRAAGHVCRPLSTSTTRKVHYIIRAALGRAVRWGQLGVNRAELVDPPAPAATEPDPPSPEEAAALLNDAWQDPEWGLMLWLTMLSGARRGEVCALRWHDLDTTRAVLSVPASISQTKRTGLTRKPTKSEKGRRVSLDPYTLSLLAEHRARREQLCAALGVTLTADSYLFSPDPDSGAPWPPRTVSQRYRTMARRLGLRSTRLHSLRHYSATELLAAGVDLRTVAGRLGHGSGGVITLRTYAAWVDHADRQASETMAGILPRPGPVAEKVRSPYQQIAADLRGAITSGALSSGGQLPTVAQLAAKYGVSVGTAHRAIAALASEGLIEVTRGRRATVASKPVTAQA